MKLFSYLIPLLMIFIVACEESPTTPQTGSLCSVSGEKVCSESYIEVLQCGNDLTWHTIEICQTTLGQHCVEAAGTAYCHDGGGTSDEDTLQLPDKDAVTPDKDVATLDKDTVDADTPTTTDNDTTTDSEEEPDSDATEEPDNDTVASCGDGKVDEIFNDLKKEYANNSQVSIADSDVSESTITAAQSGTIDSFSYKFHIAHSRPADLKVELISPTGTAHTICSACTTVDLQNRDETITTFDGEAGDGEWLLKVTDSVSGNNGMINYFRISMDLHIFVSGEECDDGNTVDTDDCTNSCKTPVCGDGIIWDGHEECDGVNDGSYGNCATDCLALANHCGDGTITDSEICDDGTDNGSYDNCGTDCLGLGEHCGDAAVNGPESCDDGVNDGTYGHCLSDCSALGPHCGDGSTSDAEVCDDGVDNGTYGNCADDCSVDGLHCGDSILTTPEEVCDDGLNDGSYGHCNADCQSMGNYCGDGAVTDAEGCDDSNSETEKCEYNETACTVCDATCQEIAGETTYCGDSIIDTAEESCDDGVNDGSYGHCNSDCQSMANYCGDGTITDAEVCDDGELNGTYDHCKLDCSGVSNCGDGLLEGHHFDASYANETDVAIPDNTPAGVYSDIVVAETGLITSLSYQINVIHTYKGDVNLNLISPAGTVLKLWEHMGKSTDNVYVIDSTDVFNGEELSGTWRAHAVDIDGNQVGTIDYFRLTDVDYRDAVSEVCDEGADNNTYQPEAMGHCSQDCTGFGSGGYCGDGTTQTGETCDDGATNGVYGSCALDCSGTTECGDGVVQGEISGNFAQEADVTVPDHLSVYSDLVIAEHGIITTLNYSVYIAHGCRKDMMVDLIAPDGTTERIWASENENCYNNLTLTGVAATFAGKQLKGTWRLKVHDYASGDTGTIQYFRLNAQYTRATGGTETCDDGNDVDGDSCPNNCISTLTCNHRLHLWQRYCSDSSSNCTRQYITIKDLTTSTDIWTGNAGDYSPVNHTFNTTHGHLIQIDFTNNPGNSYYVDYQYELFGNGDVKIHEDINTTTNPTDYTFTADCE